jgi:hypothetical protein
MLYNKLELLLTGFTAAPCCCCCFTYASDVAGEGDKLSLVTIGDKGRAQLQRVAPEKIKLSIQDTYKDKVTFSQVRLLYLCMCSYGWVGGWVGAAGGWVHPGHLQGQGHIQAGAHRTGVFVCAHSSIKVEVISCIICTS